MKCYFLYNSSEIADYAGTYAAGIHEVSRRTWHDGHYPTFENPGVSARVCVNTTHLYPVMAFDSRICVNENVALQLFRLARVRLVPVIFDIAYKGESTREAIDDNGDYNSWVFNYRGITSFTQYLRASCRVEPPTTPYFEIVLRELPGGCLPAPLDIGPAKSAKTQLRIPQHQDLLKEHGALAYNSPEVVMSDSVYELLRDPCALNPFLTVSEVTL